MLLSFCTCLHELKFRNVVNFVCVCVVFLCVVVVETKLFFVFGFIEGCFFGCFQWLVVCLVGCLLGFAFIFFIFFMVIRRNFVGAEFPQN